MSEVENRLNREAAFLPQASDGVHPCVEVGGVQVYVYFAGGKLNVSVHYDTAVDEVLSAEGTVPTRLDMGNEIHEWD